MLEEIKLPTTEEESIALREYLKDQPSEDIADYIRNLDDRDAQVEFIKVLDPEDAAIVFFELEDYTLLSDVILSLPPENARAITAEIPADDATDLLSEMPEPFRSRVLSLFEDETAEEIRSLMVYEDGTAGSLMTTEFVVVPAFATVEKAIEIIRSFAPDAETIYYVYVIDGVNHLVGILSLRELLIAPLDEHVGNIMHSNVIHVNVHDDQENLAEMMTKYNFLALPVVDNENHILGIVTVDDIVDVIHEEATEDIYRMAGISEAENEEDGSFFSAYKARMPWLLVTIVGELGSGTVLAGFEVKLEAVVALAFFIPLLTGLAGNVGTQSSTVTVRGIATGTITAAKALRTIIREVFIGLSLGITVGIIVACIATVWLGHPELGIVVGITLLFNNLMAALMGTLVPLTFMKLNIDPAVASAPFITTVVDIVGLLNYTFIATMILGL